MNYYSAYDYAPYMEQIKPKPKDEMKNQIGQLKTQIEDLKLANMRFEEQNRILKEKIDLKHLEKLEGQIRQLKSKNFANETQYAP